MINDVKVNYTDKLSYWEWEKLCRDLKKQKKQERAYFVKQKLFGASLIVCSILLGVFLGAEAIVAGAFLVPLGIAVMVTKDRVVG